MKKRGKIMKKIKWNITFLSPIIVITLIAILEICYAYNVYNVYKKNENEYLVLFDKCQKSETELTNCSSLISKGKPIIPDTITLFFIVLTSTDLIQLQILFPIAIIIISSNIFYHTYKTNTYKKHSSKNEYKDNLKKSYFNALKSIWIFPIFLLILFVVCFIMSGNFDIDKTLSYYQEESIPISVKYIKNYIPFMCIYIFNVIINSCIYVNISLMTIKKSSNLIISTLSSYTLILFCSIFFEVILGNFLLEKCFKVTNASNILNIFNYWTYDSLKTPVALVIFTIYNVTLVIVSFSILKKIYINKDNVVPESENNL